MTLAFFTLTLVATLLAPGKAEASHFRYGHISWTAVGGTAVEFSVAIAARRSYAISVFACADPATSYATTIACTGPGGRPGVGDVISLDMAFFFGDGNSLPNTGVYATRPKLVVTAIDTVDDWLIGQMLDPNSFPGIDTSITHDYAASGAGDYTAALASCCRVGQFSGGNWHINNPDTAFRLETVVNAGNITPANDSPVSSLSPIVFCPKNAVCNFTVPGADANGDPLSFRFATATEAAGAFVQPGPLDATNAASINAATGDYTWDTNGATLAPSGSLTLYSSQVMIEDLDPSNAVMSKVPLEFLIALVDDVGVPPEFVSPTPACSTGLTANSGDPIAFTVQASDSDTNQTVTLNASGMPAGATMTPALPTSGNPVSSAFSWTPADADEGIHVITFSALDSFFRQTLCSITVEVIVVTEIAGDVDIKPGSDPNSINRKSRGNIPVAVFSSSDFDATTLLNVMFAGAMALEIGQSPQDIDGDGLLDQVFHFATQEAVDLALGDVEACLTGDTPDGTPFIGCDSVRIVK